MLLLFLRVLRELGLDGLASDTGRANGVEFVAQNADDLGRDRVVQERDRVLNLAAVVLRDRAVAQLLPRAVADLLDVREKRMWSAHSVSSSLAMLECIIRTNLASRHFAPSWSRCCRPTGRCRQFGGDAAAWITTCVAPLPERRRMRVRFRRPALRLPTRRRRPCRARPAAARRRAWSGRGCPGR